MHPVLPEDAPEEVREAHAALRAPLLLNSALAALKAPGAPAENAQTALKATERALTLSLSDADRGA